MDLRTARKSYRAGCTRCATQIAVREKPELRTVKIGSRTVSYWEAGASLSPYSRGYFPATRGAMLAWVYEAPDEEAGVHHGFDSGGFASGEGDGGGGGDVGGF